MNSIFKPGISGNLVKSISKISFCCTPINQFRSVNKRFGGESLIIPIEDLCKTDQSLYGTTVISLYIENKLSRIQLYRPNMQDSKLMD